MAPMQGLEEGFFEDIARDIKKANDIANFQEEIPRDDDHKAILDYIVDATDQGFVLNNDRLEELNMEKVKTSDEFIAQKINDIDNEASKKWKE